MNFGKLFLCLLTAVLIPIASSAEGPGTKPAEFLREVRRRSPQTVVIIVTSYGSIEGAVEAEGRAARLPGITREGGDSRICVAIVKDLVAD